MDRARLIIDPPGDGAWNMAVDQALLDSATENGLTTLRFYQWKEPTLSLGYFQNHEDRALHLPSQNCPLVRRRTGGGAILHDRELTYSLCVPSRNRWSTRNGELYETIHQIIIDYLSELDINASLFRDDPTAAMSNRKSEIEKRHNTVDTSNQPSVDQNAFMCFQRRSPGDVVLKGYKIVGSAQRRGKSALLQHGSILLERSGFAPDLAGIGDLGAVLSVTKTIEKFCALAENQLRINLFVAMLSKFEKEVAKGVYSAQFGNRLWNERR